MSTVSYSTAQAGGSYAIYLHKGASNTISDCYLQGSTAAYVQGSTGTVITGSVLAATNTSGSGLWLGGGSVNLTLSSTSIEVAAGRSGIFLDNGNNGVLSLSSDSIAFSQFGLNIATQAAGASLTTSGLSFNSLLAGATAVNFLGGTFVSTFAAAYFNESVAVNVNASALSSGTSLSMINAGGPMAGAGYSDDPGGYVSWVEDENYMAGRARRFSALLSLPADPTFLLREVYAFPNPAKRMNPTIHVEVGVADSVDIHIYDISGRLLQSQTLYGAPQLINDGSGRGLQYAYEWTWNASGVSSGVYLYVMTAHLNGQSDLRTTKKVALVK